MLRNLSKAWNTFNTYTITALDLGTGTGRIPLLLNGKSVQVVGLDISQAMLYQNQTQRAQISGDWTLIRGDMRQLPIISGWADITCAGWAFGHLQSWFSAEWRSQIGHALNEMQRVAGPGGSLVILETLYRILFRAGVGYPNPPTGLVTSAGMERCLVEEVVKLEGLF